MSGRDRAARLLAAALLGVALACRREPAPVRGAAANAGVPESRFPAPSRPVASIVSPEWATEEQRDDAGEYPTVVSRLGIGAGTRVADVGAGTGYYTVRLSRTVGRTGHVYAEDIVPDYVAALRKRAVADSNVTVVLGEPHDPHLPPASADVALLVHMYHEISQPFALLYNLAPALRPGGRVAVLDMNRPTPYHGTPPALLDCEMRAMGYAPQTRQDVGGGAYLAVYTLPSLGALTPPDSVAPRLERGGCGGRPR